MIDEPEDEDDDLLDLLSWWGVPLLDPLGNARRAAEAEVKRPARKPAPARLLEWTGTKRALGDKAIAMRKRGELKADSDDNAVRILCARYVDNHGERINPKNIVDSLKARKRLEGK